ncbi:MAG TPA: hypothetical protein VIL99_17015 [Ignavibacteria bacterium]
MRKAFLTLLFIFTTHICSAPTIDFRLGMLKTRLFIDYVNDKYHESEFSRFINDLGSKESGNNWLSINQIGCFGEWQFDESTLKFLGYRKITLKKFKENPEIFPRELQLKALKTLIRVNLTFLNEYEHFIGDTINGIIITKSGMIAASHLGGAGSLQKFLNSNGRINKKDILGTSIFDYLRKFSSYNIE